MPQFETPEGYAPYRLFTFSDGVCYCALRPEQFVAVTTVHPGFHEPTGSVASDWGALIVLKDGSLSLPFGTGEGGQRRTRVFIDQLREFMEEDALRNTHNAMMRKGKTNG